jgi:hypothetical protein
VLIEDLLHFLRRYDQQTRYVLSAGHKPVTDIPNGLPRRHAQLCKLLLRLPVTILSFGDRFGEAVAYWILKPSPSSAEFSASSLGVGS